MESFTTGALAKKVGVKTSTIRYYERRGLLPEPARLAGGIHHDGYRQYDENALARLHFIKNAQQLGFSLSEIEELLKLRVDGNNTCATVRGHVQDKMADIDQKIKSLKQFKKALGNLADQCNDGQLNGDCPILDALESEKG